MMSSDHLITKATTDDFSFLSEIDRTGCERDGIEWVASDRQPLVQKFIEGTSQFAFIAREGKTNVGAILLRERGLSDPTVIVSQQELLRPLIGVARFVDVFELWVHPEFRRKGVARNLKAMVEEECRKRSIQWIFTFQHPDNIGAIRMNESLDYKRIGAAQMWDDVLRICFLKHIGTSFPSISPSLG